MMEDSLEATKRAFNSIRTGRANASLLDRVMVEYYGAPTPLKTLANIGTPDASTIVIQPYDSSTLSLIERAINLSDVGLVPNNDGKVVRLNIPPLTEERRKEFVKQASKEAENGKVSVRNARREGVDLVKKKEKAKEYSKDEALDLQDEIQKLTDTYIKKIEGELATKEKDIMSV
ncbi:MAG: ribosome recycling factor [Merismopedia sp. SIO2A8]|nr:ribosome recycling factor [Symploca sp. SIO2B6]NET47434.1 ribosome recycling factor [Merismopedia sp. SIO2A8]